jgi:hypothetical protein
MQIEGDSRGKLIAQAVKAQRKGDGANARELLDLAIARMEELKSNTTERASVRAACRWCNTRPAVCFPTQICKIGSRLKSDCRRIWIPTIARGDFVAVPTLEGACPNGKTNLCGAYPPMA